MNLCQGTAHVENVSTVPIVPAKSNLWEDSGKEKATSSDGRNLERIPTFNLGWSLEGTQSGPAGTVVRLC